LYINSAEQDCPELNLLNGKVLEQKNNGSMLRFLCNDGYQLVGSVVRFCGSNGIWTGKETTCLLSKNRHTFNQL